jgi:flagellar biosynthesis/type III secretory pathway M-ring protein FliF/YscJ
MEDHIITYLLIGIIIIAVVAWFVIRKSIQNLQDNISKLEADLKRPPKRKKQEKEEEEEFSDPYAIRVSRLQPGDVLREDVITKNDKRLLEKGSALSEKNISKLKQWGIKVVKIEK